MRVAQEFTIVLSSQTAYEPVRFVQLLDFLEYCLPVFGIRVLIPSVPSWSFVKLYWCCVRLGTSTT